MKLTGMLIVACAITMFNSCEKDPVTAAPHGLAVSDVGATSATFSWEGDAASYELSVGTITETVNAKTFTYTMFTADTDYTWKVRAIDGNSPSDWVAGPAFSTIAEQTTLSIDTSSLVFAANEEGEDDIKSVKVTTDAADWDATTDADWLKLDKDGFTLSIMALEANLGNAPFDAPLTATITFTAVGAEPVSLPVTQEITPIIEYNTMAGMYYGDYYNLGNANFVVQGGGTLVGFTIEGFTSLPTSFEEFKLDAGRYTFAKIDPKTGVEEGKLHTFIGGYPLISPMGTTVYDYVTDPDNPEFVYVTGGTVDMEVSGYTHTITANFSGIDIDDNPVENVRVRFIGTIGWANYSRQ